MWMCYDTYWNKVNVVCLSRINLHVCRNVNCQHFILLTGLLKQNWTLVQQVCKPSPTRQANVCISAEVDFEFLASFLSFRSCCARTLPCTPLRKECDLSHEDFKDAQKTNHYLRASGEIWRQRGRLSSLLSVATYKRCTHFYLKVLWCIIWPSLFKAYCTCLLFLLRLLWHHIVLLNMLCLDSGIWNSPAPTSPTAQINATSWASAVCLLILTAQGLVVLPLLFTPFFLSLTPPLCLIFSCSLLSPLLPVKFHFTD